MTDRFHTPATSGFALGLAAGRAAGYDDGFAAGRRQGHEEAAKLIETYREASDSIGKHLTRRRRGDMLGLAFARAIRLLASTPDDPASRTE